MDLSKPNTTSGEEYAGPAREEAMAPSADCGTAERDPADDREAGAGPRVEGPLWGDHISRFHSPSESASVPTMGPIAHDDAENVSGINFSNDVVAVANPIATPIVDKSMPFPHAKAAQMPVSYFGITRRQKRRINERERKKMHHQISDLDAGCSSRKRSLAMTADSSQTGIEVKRTKVESQTEMPSTEKVAIIPVNFPAEQILLNHIAAIQEAVITRLVDAPDPLPHVTCGSLLGGALFFSCVGRDSVNWLAITIGERKIAGLNLKVVDAKDLPKPIKMAWKTKIVGVQDIKLLFRVLQRYNPGLNTNQWKVIDTSVENMSSRRIILMDRASADVIRDAGYCLHSGIDISTFKLLEDSERGAKSVDNDLRNAPGDS